MIEELKKAGILDVSAPLFEQFEFEPDLLAYGYTISQNLRNIIRQTILYIPALLGKGINLEDDPYDIKLFVIATRQGVHIEIPAAIFRTSNASARVAQHCDYLDDFYNRNIPKMELVRRFYQE